MIIKETLKTIQSLLQIDKYQVVNNDSLEIKEEGKQASLRKVQLIGVGQSAFAIQYDKCGFPGNALFAPHATLHRACDAIVFCEIEETPYILCCELKSTEPISEDTAVQFHNARCFLDYLDSILKQYYDGNTIDNWSRRYFVFHDKEKTKLRKENILNRDRHNNTCPERALFVPTHDNNKNIVRQLLGKPL
jgi:hypothetical protein